MKLISRTGILLVFAAAFAVSASAQRDDMTIPAGGPFSRDTVVNAPFSADVKTTIRMQLPDSSTRDYTVTARYYRNSQGRVRAEMDTPEGPFVVLEIPPGRTTREHTRSMCWMRSTTPTAADPVIR